MHVLAELSYLGPHHQTHVERLVRNLLTKLGAQEDGELAIDPLKVAILVSEEIDRRYRTSAVRFELSGESRTVAISPFEWRVSDDFTMPLHKDSVTEWQ
jgi:hypothetical protein